MRPEPTTYPSYFNTYIKLVEGSEISKIINRQSPIDISFFESINEEQSLYKYQEEKWTVKEILQHVIDTERIFCFRALAIARREGNTLPGFDENEYGKHSHANDRTWESLVNEFRNLRSATISLVESFNEGDLQVSGSVNDYHITVSAICYTIVGHVQHHIHIIRERYLDI